MKATEIHAVIAIAASGQLVFFIFPQNFTGAPRLNRLRPAIWLNIPVVNYAFVASQSGPVAVRTAYTICADASIFPGVTTTARTLRGAFWHDLGLPEIKMVANGWIRTNDLQLMRLAR
jgi:hypothetical protein